MEIPAKLAFIKSTRFWAMIIGSIIVYLEKEMIINGNLATMLETIFFGFTGVGTFDKLAKNLGDKPSVPTIDDLSVREMETK